MNSLIAMTSEMTMSTLDFLSEVINPAREQANETPHEPRKFLAKVEDELDLDATGKKFRLNSNQTESAYYDLSMDQLMLVGMRESKLVRVSVLAKLKAMSKPAIQQTYASALLEAGRLAMEVERQAEQLAIAAPKVEFVDKFVTSTGNLGFRQVAKLLKVKETDLRAFLISNKVMYRLAGAMTPYSEHIYAGRFEVKAGVADHGDSSHAYSQAKFTPKGVEWLAGELAKAEAKKLMGVV